MKKLHCLLLFLMLILFNQQTIATTNSVNPVITKNKIPLPLAKKIALQTTQELEHFDIVKKVEEAVLVEEPPVAGYSFPSADMHLAKLNTATPPVNGDPMSDLLIKIGSGDGSSVVREAKQVLDNAIKAGNFITKLTGEDLVSLPLVIKQDLGNLTAHVVFNSIALTPNGATIEVIAGITIPQKSYDPSGRKVETTLMFKGTNIQISQEGGIQTGEIVLMAPIAFELGGSSKKAAVVLEPGVMDNNGTVTAGTSVKLGCGGILEFGIGATVYFSRDWMLPVNRNDEVIGGTTRVAASFQRIEVQDWNNLLVENVSVDRFVLTEYQDLGFYVANANLDLSDYRNPTSLKFPDGYNSPPNSNLWRGVYVEALEILLPKPFKQKCGGFGSTDNCRMKLAAKDLLIDNTGVSGKFSVNGQMPLVGGGQIDGKWAWSLDEVGIHVVQNNFRGFNFNGVISVPIASEQTPIAYTGEVRFGQGNPYYHFTAGLANNLAFPMFNAINVTLRSGTKLDVVYDEATKEFLPKFVLYGDMQVGKPEPADNMTDASKAQLPSVSFDGLVAQTRSPFLSVEGGISISGENGKVVNFPVTISGISLAPSDETAILGFDIGLNLTSPENGGVNATGGFAIHAKMEEDINGSQRWKFDKFKFSGAQVKLDFKQVKACGTLTLFEDDPIYGNGFNAVVQAEILGDIPVDALCAGGGSNAKFKLDMSAIFGKTDGYRYFLLDGYVGGSAINIPLAPTPLIMNGFGGGVFHHMKPTSYNTPAQNGSAMGTDASGIVYQPTQATKLGAKFVVGLTSATGTMNGKLTCLMRFGRGMSLQNVTFWGVADFLTPEINIPDISSKTADLVDTEEEMHRKDTAEAQQVDGDKISLKLGLSLDFVNGFKFHGFAQAYLNAADSQVQGKGTLDLLLDPNANKWHLYVGGYHDPAVMVEEFGSEGNNLVRLYPVNAQVSYAEINARADAYFLVGNDIPGAPKLHPAAAAYFGTDEGTVEDNRALLRCDGRSAASGTGLAFGAGMEVSFEQKKKKLGVTLYDIQVKGGVGFDLALLKYGDSFNCNGNQNHGLNKSRASGNIWAFVNAKGKVFVVPIPELGVGVKLAADIPNPGSFDAVVVINLWKKLRFGFEVGTQCNSDSGVCQ